MSTSKREDLLREYRRLAKRADQRLVRLERYAEKTGFESVKKYAYRVAMRDIRAWSGSEAKRFNTKAPKNTNQLKAKIADIKKFLESASSTLKPTKETKGILAVYESRANTINDKYGTNFTWESLATFYESGINEKLDSKYDSKTKMEIIAEIQANRSDVESMIKGKVANINVSDDVLAFQVNEVIKEYGKEVIKALT